MYLFIPAGHNKSYRTSFRYHNDNFYCGNFNVLLALNDIGPGDGGTMIVPGSHKCNVVNPLVFEQENGRHKNVVEQTELTPYLKEMHLNAGDAVIFTDACTHGASVRTNDGERRILIYRYTAFWMKNATGFEPSGRIARQAHACTQKNCAARCADKTACSICDCMILKKGWEYDIDTG